MTIATEHAGTARPVPDVPESELTPNVRGALQRLRGELEALRGELAAARQEITALEQLADRDGLLPVFNRRAFVRELARAVYAARRYGGESCLVYLDVNDLKGLNDRFGHAAGDAALLHIAATILAHVRQSDVVGRLGGDELGVILGHADAATAQAKSANLAEIVRTNPLRWQGDTIAMSVSVGVAALDGHAEAEAVVAAADRAMYATRVRR